jgi:hypothetical protein
MIRLLSLPAMYAVSAKPATSAALATKAGRLRSLNDIRCRFKVEKFKVPFRKDSAESATAAASGPTSRESCHSCGSAGAVLQ